MIDASTSEKIARDTIDLCAYWYDRPLSGEQYLRLIASYLKRLQEADPVFSDLFVVGESRSKRPKIERDYSNFDSDVSAALPQDWAYTNPNSADKKFTPSSLSRDGFINSFVTDLNGAAPHCAISTSMGSTDRDSSNTVIVRVAPGLLSTNSLENLFKLTIAYWRPLHANLAQYELRKFIGITRGEIGVGLLTYLSIGEAANAVPEDIVVERYLDGLIIPATDALSETPEPRTIARLRRIHEALKSKGLLRRSEIEHE
jgi:hypothetical protein